MRVSVRKLFHQGRAMPKVEKQQHGPFVGKLRIAPARLQRSERVLVTAQLFDTSADAQPLMMELHDVVLLHLDDGKMRLRGWEVDGVCEYGRTWDVEVL